MFSIFSKIETAVEACKAADFSAMSCHDIEFQKCFVQNLPSISKHCPFSFNFGTVSYRCLFGW